MSSFSLNAGHDRSIPGHDRYSMPGSAKSGDASLQIINLTISDSGDYECQVAPVPSGNHPLLRRKTYLEVTGNKQTFAIKLYWYLTMRQIPAGIKYKIQSVIDQLLIRRSL